MRCIFCKEDSTDSRSVEHIVPESLGNTDHVLQPGIVCDACNQYFARKLERPVLEAPIFRNLRTAMAIPNKRGRVPQWVHDDSRPDYRLMSRFLAKIGVEVLASRVKEIPSCNEDLVALPGLDAIRTYARFGVGPTWPFTMRPIHPVNAVFTEDDNSYEVLHEFTILYTSRFEVYVAVSLFGVEFVMNLGGRELDGFKEWLEHNEFASPLYLPSKVVAAA